jgi:hypothetical protein
MTSSVVVKTPIKYSISTNSSVDNSTTNEPANLVAQASQEQESLIDYESSEDDEVDDSQSGNEEKETATNSNLVTSALPFSTPILAGGTISQLVAANAISDNKHSTIWIGNDDGRYDMMQKCTSYKL